MKVVLPIVYLGNINYYSVLLKHKEHIVFDKFEHFVKQSYRSRAEIYGANGKLALLVPLEKRNKRTPMKDVKIAYHENWQKLHWKSFESAYRSSPYFEFYEHEFEAFYLKNKFEYLIDFSLALQDVIFRLLNVSIETKFTTEYEFVEGDDYRKLIHPKTKLSKPYPAQQYMQVFENKEGYISNLSILDLLFNEGPNAISFLTN